LPRGANPVEVFAEADPVDRIVAGEPANQHRALVRATGTIGRPREEERLALFLGNTTSILPPH
jgi:hypothetical protein